MIQFICFAIAMEAFLNNIIALREKASALIRLQSGMYINDVIANKFVALTILMKPLVYKLQLLTMR